MSKAVIPYETHQISEINLLSVTYLDKLRYFSEY